MTLKTSYKPILIASVLIVLTINPNSGQNSLQSQSSLTIEQAKERLEQLHDEYLSIDVIFRQKIEAEVVKQVGTSSKGEFETTPEYKARLARANSIGKQLEAKYEAEIIRRKSEIKKQIDHIIDLEFTKPVVIVTGVYDADGETFPLSVVDTVNSETYDDALFVPRSDARSLKLQFSEVEKRGLFGVRLEHGKAVEYFFAVRINFQGKQYSSVTLLKALERELRARLSSGELEGDSRLRDFEESGSSLAVEMELKGVDLDGDGVQEFILKVPSMNFCGSGGCETWLYKKKGERYVLMLDEDDIKPMKSITNGYRDLEASHSSGAYDISLKLYKFDGKHYRKVKCTERSYDSKIKRRVTTTIKCDDSPYPLYPPEQ